VNMSAWSAFLPLLVGVAAGASLICQQAINARLKASLESDYWTGFFSYFCGTTAMLLAVLLTRQPMVTSQSAASAPWWSWTGGAFGAVYILAAIMLVPKLGTTLTLSCVVLGQVVMSLIFDQFGLLGVPQHPATSLRILGVCLVAGGMLLVRR